jgi:hypothetical protein
MERSFRNVTVDAGQAMVLIEREDTFDVDSNSQLAIRFADVRNPTISGDAGAYQIQTLDSEGILLDSSAEHGTHGVLPEASAAVRMVIRPARMEGVHVHLSSTVAGAGTMAAVSFSLRNDLPIGGTIDLRFNEDFGAVENAEGVWVGGEGVWVGVEGLDRTLGAWMSTVSSLGSAVGGGYHISVRLVANTGAVGAVVGATAGTTIRILVGGLVNPAAAGVLQVCTISTNSGSSDSGGGIRIIDAAEETSFALKALIVAPSSLPPAPTPEAVLAAASLALGSASLVIPSATAGAKTDLQFNFEGASVDLLPGGAKLVLTFPSSYCPSGTVSGAGGYYSLSDLGVAMTDSTSPLLPPLVGIWAKPTACEVTIAKISAAGASTAGAVTTITLSGVRNPPPSTVDVGHIRLQILTSAGLGNEIVALAAPFITPIPVPPEVGDLTARLSAALSHSTVSAGEVSMELTIELTSPLAPQAQIVIRLPPSFNMSAASMGGTGVVHGSTNYSAAQFASRIVSPPISGIGDGGLKEFRVTYEGGCRARCRGKCWGRCSDTLPAATTIRIGINGLRNPAVSGDAGHILVRMLQIIQGEEVVLAAGTVSLSSGSIQPAAILPGSVALALSHPFHGALTSVQLSFTTSTGWPADGRIVLGLPAPFSVAEVGAVRLHVFEWAASAGVAGGLAVGVRDGSSGDGNSSTIITLSRINDGETTSINTDIPPSSLVKINISAIRMLGFQQLSFGITVLRTETKDGAVIDEVVSTTVHDLPIVALAPAPVVAAYTAGVGVLSDVSMALSDVRAGAAGVDATIRLTTSAAIPADGAIYLFMPVDTIAGGSTAATSFPAQSIQQQCVMHPLSSLSSSCSAGTGPAVDVEVAVHGAPGGVFVLSTLAASASSSSSSTGFAIVRTGFGTQAPIPAGASLTISISRGINNPLIANTNLSAPIFLLRSVTSAGETIDESVAFGLASSSAGFATVLPAPLFGRHLSFSSTVVGMPTVVKLSFGVPNLPNHYYHELPTMIEMHFPTTMRTPTTEDNGGLQILVAQEAGGIFTGLQVLTTEFDAGMLRLTVESGLLGPWGAGGATITITIIGLTNPRTVPVVSTANNAKALASLGSFKMVVKRAEDGAVIAAMAPMQTPTLAPLQINSARVRWSEVQVGRSTNVTLVWTSSMDTVSQASAVDLTFPIGVILAEQAGMALRVASAAAADAQLAFRVAGVNQRANVVTIGIIHTNTTTDRRLAPGSLFSVAITLSGLQLPKSRGPPGDVIVQVIAPGGEGAVLEQAAVDTPPILLGRMALVRVALTDTSPLQSSVATFTPAPTPPFSDSTPSTAGSTNFVQVEFDLASYLPRKGKIELLLPAGFDASQAYVARQGQTEAYRVSCEELATSGDDGGGGGRLDGGLVVTSIIDGIISLKRCGDGSTLHTAISSSTSSLRFVLGGVRLPQVSGPCGTFAVLTRNSAGEVIDGGSSTNAEVDSDVNAGGGRYDSYRDMQQEAQASLVIAPGVLLGAEVAVWAVGTSSSSSMTIRAGSAVDLRVDFMSTNPIPIDGRIEIDLLGGFSIDITACVVRGLMAGLSGNLSIIRQTTASSNLTVVLQRSGASATAVPGGRAVGFELGGNCIRAPPVSGGADDGTTGFVLRSSTGPSAIVFAAIDDSVTNHGLLPGIDISAGILTGAWVEFDTVVRGKLTALVASFTTANPIPVGGWVAVHFPPEYTPARELAGLQASFNGVGPFSLGQGVRLTVDENCGRPADGFGSEPAQCETNTGGLCRFSSCYSWRGATTCQSGKCLCQPGHCANSDGKCVERVCAVVETRLTDAMSAVLAGDDVTVELTGIVHPDHELAPSTHFFVVRTYSTDGRLVDRDTPKGKPVIRAADLVPGPWDGPWLYSARSHIFALVIPLLLLQLLIYRTMRRWKTVKAELNRYSPCCATAVGKILPMDPEVADGEVQSLTSTLTVNNIGVFDSEGNVIEERVGGLLPPKAPTEVRAVISGPKRLTVYFQPVLNDHARMNNRFSVSWYRVTATPDVSRVKSKNKKALQHGGRRNSLVRMPSQRVLTDSVVVGMGKSSPIVLEGLMPGMIYNITATSGSPGQYGKEGDLLDDGGDEGGGGLIGGSMKAMLSSFQSKMGTFRMPGGSFIGSFRSGKSQKFGPKKKKTPVSADEPRWQGKKREQGDYDAATGSYRIVKAHPTKEIMGGQIEIVERGGVMARATPKMATTAPNLARKQRQLTRKLSNFDTNLLGKNEVGYRVWSAPSKPAAPIAAAVPPTVPRQIWVSTMGQSGKVHFQQPQTDGGVPVNYYEVVAHPCSADGYALEAEGDEYAKENRRKITVSGDQTFGDIPDLVWGVAYRFTVMGVNGVGEGPRSVFTTVLIVTAPPSAPLSVKGFPGVESALVSWDAPKISGGLAVDQYEVQVWELPPQQDETRYASVVGANGIRTNAGT